MTDNIESLSIEALEDGIKEGNIEYQCELGRRYWLGKGVKKDYDKAFKLIEPCAEKGNILAQKTLGLLYYNGEGVELDNNKGIIGSKGLICNNK